MLKCKFCFVIIFCLLILDDTNNAFAQQAQNSNTLDNDIAPTTVEFHSSIPGWTNFAGTDGLTSDSILSTRIDSSGNRWIGSEAGINLYTRSGEWHSLSDANGLPGLKIFDIHIDSNNPDYFWVVTEGGAAAFNTHGVPTEIAAYTWTTFREHDGLATNALTAVGVDQNGYVWFGSGELDGDRNEIGDGISFLNHNGTPEDKTDDAWKTFNNANSPLSSDVIRSISPDSSQDPTSTTMEYGVWIATQRNLNWVTTAEDAQGNLVEKWTVYTPADGLPSINIRNLLVTDEYLWVATNGGIAVLSHKNTLHDKSDDEWLTITAYDDVGLRSNGISSLALDAEGRLWVGTNVPKGREEEGDGIFLFDPSGTIMDPSDDRIFKPISNYRLTDTAIRSIAAQPDQQVWVGTPDGLNQIDYGEENDSRYYDYLDAEVTQYKAAEKLRLSPTAVTTLPNGQTLWANGNGMVIHNIRNTPEDRLDDYWSNPNGYEGGQYYWGSPKVFIFDDGENLWVAGEDGVTMRDFAGTPFDTSDDRSLRFRRYRDPENETSYSYYDPYIENVTSMDLSSTDEKGNILAWISMGNYLESKVVVLGKTRVLTDTDDALWGVFTPENSSLPTGKINVIAAAPDVRFTTDVDAQKRAALGASRPNVVWIGRNNGLTMLDHGGTPFNKSDDSWKNYTTQNSALSFDLVRDLVLDQNNNLWIAVAAGGINVLTADGEWLLFNEVDGLGFNSVNTLALHENQVWVGTEGGGVSRLDHGGTLKDRSDDQWATHPGGQAMQSGIIRDLHVDRLGQLWVATFGGGGALYSTYPFEQIYMPIYLERYDQ